MAKRKQTQVKESAQPTIAAPIPVCRDRGRRCFVCGELGPKEGPLSYDWDTHNIVKGQTVFNRQVSELVLTCSAKCRAEAGLKERKVTV